MVVVSGSWVKNVATYPTPAVNNDMVIPTNNMNAKAVLICRPNSHPFQERTLCLNQPVKVGRSVARARATSTNAIFDCKVLSRHHALLWYDCGKFYLQDTKSSNGTFVNNNRLSSSESEPHEVSSGDIVQFGVDVLENNRKVTHGCIIATLKLYLPDGKEAKASPSITEANRHGLVPLDELYKLNQIIQEATQREQCLESKLTALQNVVEEARKSADQSWQVYIGEERLLSRVAALESQLTQAGKSWGDDRLREELSKLQEDRGAYQVAAKDALHKLHNERLEAVAVATEQERARITAEQEALLAKEQLLQLQQELHDVAQKLSEEQKRSDEQKIQLEQRERELQARLESESQTVCELQTKIEQLSLLTMNPLEELEKCNLIYNDDLKAKEEMLAENDCSNGIIETERNHISLTVAPVTDDCNLESAGSDPEISPERKSHTPKLSADNLHQVTMVESDFAIDDEAEEKSKEDMPESAKEVESDMFVREYTDEKESRVSDQIDSKTLKYQFQSAQNELKKQIERLEQLSNVNKNKISELEVALSDEKELSSQRSEECDLLKQELFQLQQKCKESCNENQQLRDRVNILTKELKKESEGNLKFSAQCESFVHNPDNFVNYEQLTAVEEELVLLKERYAQVNDEKLLLNKKLIILRDQYNSLCNRSYNQMFFYIAPLVIMVLYLLISSMFS